MTDELIATPCDRCATPDRGAGWLCAACNEPPAVLNDSAKWATCLHEASHASVGLAMGFTPDVVSIKPGRTFRGIAMVVPREYEADPTEAMVCWDPMLPLSMRDRLEASVIRTLAGPIGGHLAGLSGFESPEALADEEAAAQSVASWQALLDRQRERVATAATAETSVTDEDSARQTVALIVNHNASAGAYQLELLRSIAEGWVVALVATIYAVAQELWLHETIDGAVVVGHYPNFVYPQPQKGS